MAALSIPWSTMESPNGGIEEAVDKTRLSKTMAFLLRHRPDVGGLKLDPEGFVAIDELRRALSRLLREEISSERLAEAIADAPVRRFEQVEERIRALKREEERRDEAARRASLPPDILYHATTDDLIEQVRETRQLTAGPERQIFLSTDEAQAWRVAHRLTTGKPRVLYIDAARARRHGVRFWRNKRNGLFATDSVPLQDVLNLQENFAEQISAGGIPMRRDEEGLKMALIRVTRRSGVTWEVAKGKLEHGEPPEHAAIREVREEMGVSVNLRITHSLGMVRYGFLAPGGLPRLKTVHLFLMEPEGDIESFTPAEGEGIGAVRWFTPDDAARVVTHSSLVPMLAQTVAMLAEEDEK